MEIEILETDKTKIKFKVKGETHTILNLLRKELFNDSAVKFAGYTIEHPLIDEAIFVVDTTRKDPKKTVKDAVDRIQKQLSSFETEIKKIK